MPITIRTTGPVTPYFSGDTYPTHLDIYGKGGVHPVADLTARDAIAPERRSEGMFAPVASNNTTYQLKGGITNGNWVPASFADTQQISASGIVSRASDAYGDIPGLSIVPGVIGDYLLYFTGSLARADGPVIDLLLSAAVNGVEQGIEMSYGLPALLIYSPYVLLSKVTVVDPAHAITVRWKGSANVPAININQRSLVVVRA